MTRILKSFFVGILISFLGSLPLGTLNITALQIGVQESVEKALYFSIGCLLAEMLYVRLSLVGIQWLLKQRKLMKVFDWITFGIILLLAAGSLIAASSENGAQKNFLLQNSTNRFLLGIFLSALNPVQIPFWFGWSAILFQNKILLPQNTYYNSYILGIGIGTLMASSIFIFGGKWLVSKIASSEMYFNWIIGFAFLLTALIQLYHMLFSKNAFDKIKDVDE